MAADRHLEKNRYDVITPPRVVRVWRNLVGQCRMTPMTKIRQNELEIEFQNGGHLFSETGSRFISAVDWDISSKFGMSVNFHLPKRLPSPKPNPEVDFRLYGRHLEKSIGRHSFAADSPITTKFDRLMQNDLPMTINRSKSKPEVQFQYGGRPFFERGRSLILAVDWDISSKFGMHIIGIHLLKWVPLRNLHPEVDFRFYGRHLEKSMRRQNSAADCQIIIKFDRWMQNDIPITTHESKLKSEVQFQYGSLPFSETGSSFISAVHGDISSKFGKPIVIHLLKQVPSLNLNPEVDFWLHGRHLKKSIWRHNHAMNRLITTKFGRLKQNHVPMTTHGPKSKQEIQFQYGSYPFSETGSSFISTVDWDISSKFGMQTDFCFLNECI